MYVGFFIRTTIVAFGARRVNLFKSGMMVGILINFPGGQKTRQRLFGNHLEGDPHEKFQASFNMSDKMYTIGSFMCAHVYIFYERFLNLFIVL